MFKEILLSVALFGSSVAVASTVSIPTANLIGDLPYVQTGDVYQKIGGPGGGEGMWAAKWYPEATQVWNAIEENIPQSVASIQAWLATAPVSISEPLFPMYSNDSLGGVTAQDWIFPNPAKVVTIHYGNNMLVWEFTNAITEFGVDFERGNLGMSNIRTYNTSPVPLPGAVWLFGSVLSLFGVTFIGTGRKHEQLS